MSSAATGLLLSSLRRHRRRVVTGAVLDAGYLTAEAMVPILVGVVIDRGIAPGDPAAFATWLAVLGMAFGLVWVCWRLGAGQSMAAGTAAERDLRLDVVGRVVDPRGGGEAGQLTGRLVSIATSDTHRVTQLFYAVGRGFAAVVALAVAGSTLLVMSLPLGLLVMLGAPPMLWLVQVFARPVERRSAEQQETASRASAIAVDLVTGVRVLKGLGAEDHAASRYRGVSRVALDATLHTARAQGGFEGVVLALSGVFLAVVALVGGLLAVHGDISTGQLVSAVGLARYVTTPMQMIGNLTEVVAVGRASAARIVAVLDAPVAVATGSLPAPAGATGEIRFEGVSDDPAAERGIELSVPAGGMVAVVAEPATANALIGWLGRERDPRRGRILLDGRPLTEIEPDDLRRVVVVSAHDSALFTGPLIDNVTGGGREGDVGAALRASGADQVAAAQPAGADTVLAERGTSLSGGQRQRVVLARALATAAPVLVLHDPTTAVDAVTEARIAEGIAALRRGCTTIVATTSPALLSVADTVVAIRDDVVAATGTHAELVRHDPAYRDMVLS